MKRYKCGYCGHEFDREYPRMGGGQTGEVLRSTRGRGRVRDMVKCPRCGNFLKKDSYIK